MVELVYKPLKCYSNCLGHTHTLCTHIYSILYIHKAVATDFEVVRPGSGCGLFNVGVVCFM